MTILIKDKNKKCNWSFFILWIFIDIFFFEQTAYNFAESIHFMDLLLLCTKYENYTVKLATLFKKMVAYT